MSFIAERIIFIYVGMDAMDIDLWKYVKLRSINAPSHPRTVAPSYPRTVAP